MTPPVGPEQPVDLDSLVFIDPNGDRRLAVPNGRESQLAEALIADRLLWSRQLAGYGMTHTLATVLAAVREGSTLEGRRSQVTIEQHVSGFLIGSPGGARALDSARAAARRQWATELHRQGLRPIGWHPIIVEHLGHPGEYPGPDVAGQHAGLGPVLTAEQLDRGAQVYVACVRIEGEAVPDR